MGLVARRSKYKNVPTEVEGIRFASKREAKRYWELRLLEKAGKIVSLRTQVPISIDLYGTHVCNYVADFSYAILGSAGTIYEDAKGVRTKEYKLKKKLVWACHGIAIQEV